MRLSCLTSLAWIVSRSLASLASILSLTPTNWLATLFSAALMSLFTDWNTATAPVTSVASRAMMMVTETIGSSQRCHQRPVRGGGGAAAGCGFWVLDAALALADGDCCSGLEAGVVEVMSWSWRGCSLCVP